MEADLENLSGRSTNKMIERYILHNCFARYRNPHQYIFSKKLFVIGEKDRLLHE